jgi:HAE1 family hydrophobic/amphiphilic exporter-1
MSLGGLALGIGMLVDNSIVVLESIFRKQEEGLDARRAASECAGTVAKAVTASTLTTVAVFAPLVFVEGLAGQLIRDQALVISFSLLASLAVAMTLIPTIYGLIGPGARRARADRPELPEGGKVQGASRWVAFVLMFVPRLIVRGAGRFGRWIGPWVDRALLPFDSGFQMLSRIYPRILRGALEYRGRVLSIATAALAVTVVLGLALPRNLFPPFSQGEFRFNVELPAGSALHITDGALEALAATVRDDPRVKFVHTSAGQTDLSAFAGAAREPSRGQISVLMKRADDPSGEAAIADRLRAALERLPGVTYEFERPALFSFRAPVEVEAYGYDLDTLRTVADQMALRMGRIRGLTDVESSIRIGDPEVQIAFDRARLAAMNLDPSSASLLVRNAVQGEAATQFNDLERKIDVRVRATEDERSLVTRLANLEVGRNMGQTVHLGAVANVQVERGPGDIRRIGQQRAAVITANLEGRDLGSAAEEIEAVIATLDLPPGVTMRLAGQNRELGDSFASLRFALLLAIFLVYLVMASQFESLLHPFVVMFSLPLALIGVVLALVVTLSPLSVMVLIGLVVLAGIVVNNAIVLVDYTRQLRDQGMEKVEALVEAGSVRLRPILMTTMTTVLGLMPLAIGVGEGAELRAPLAITLMGGLLISTVLTLVVIPVVYATVDRSR